MVKTYNPQHKCLKSRSVQFFTAEWISNNIIDKIESNPDIPVSALHEQLMKRFEMTLNSMKAYRANTLACEQLMGRYHKHYTHLRDYALELMKTNPGTTVRIETEPEPNLVCEFRVFKRINVCLGPLKLGYKACKRDILGLDGAFMKGPFPGQLLTAVGLDHNNGIYPLAYAIVESESVSSWSWFLEILGDDLDLNINSNFTFISDRQKGIIPAIAKLFPSAEHRFCLRHIHQNMKLKWRGKAFKDMLWNAAKATTVQEFKQRMDVLSAMNKDAHKWLSQIPAHHWTRSHFSGRAKSDVLLNNLCEVFNARLVEGRDKPIISALEFVREYLMRRIANVTMEIQKADGLLTPTITKKFELIKKEAYDYKVKWNGGQKYQVSGIAGVQFVVDVQHKVCSCRGWELLSIPRVHAVAANYDMVLNRMKVDIPEKWVDSCFWLDTWKDVYSHKIEPIHGRGMWPRSDCPTKLKEHKHHKTIGRPRKARRKDAMEKEEDVVRHGKLTKKWKTVTFSKCGKQGHNKKTCRGQPANA